MIVAPCDTVGAERRFGSTSARIGQQAEKDALNEER